ncbi:MAG: caspase family protein [Bacteroidota bacterium]
MKPITSILSLLFFFLFLNNQLVAQCVSGDCQNGDGVYVLPSGAKYYGGFKDGEIHGHGICKYTDGSSYEGQWANRFPQGQGTMTYRDGTKRSGYWSKGQPVDMNGKVMGDLAKGVANDNANIQSGCISGNCWSGKGIFAYPNGSKYRGDFIAGKSDGWGTFYYINGNKYIGEFKQGLPNGKGTMHYPSGAKRSGSWEKGEFMSSDSSSDSYSYNKKRTGCISGNCINGSGIYIFPDGKGRYSGNFKAGRPHGKGKVEYSNGDRYEGQLIDGKLSGKGIYYYRSGKVTEGYWKNGSYTGKITSKPNPTYERKAYKNNNRYNPNSSDRNRPTAAPKVWAVIVGIANYNHMPILRYTDDDAYKMYAFFKSPEGGALSDERIRILIDEEATKSKIEAAMKETFYKAGPNDLVILYFSGHGLKGSFLPIDYDGYNNKFRHGEINQILKNSPAKYKLCIADACHSGSLLTMRNSEGSVENTLASYYANLAKALPSTALMMSSKSEETSLESNSLRQGVFSHFLIRGLKGEADRNGDNIISIQELYNFVSGNVRDYTGMRQSPLIQGSYDSRMPVAVVR